MAASQPRHFGLRGKLPKSEQTHLARRLTQYIYTRDQSNHVYRAGPPTDRLLGKFPSWHQECQDTYQETRSVECTTLNGIAEEGSRPLLRQPSSTHHSAAPCHADLPWHWPREALPCCPSGSRESFWKTLKTPLPTVPSPRPIDWDPGTWLCYPPLIVLCVLYISLRLSECE